MSLTAGELAAEIVRIVETPGEDLSDGECLDAILTLLESEGYPTPWSAMRGLSPSFLDK